MNLPYITGAFIEEKTSYPTLIDHLKDGFYGNKIIVPMRNHYGIESENPGTLLLMPAWEVNKSIGIKLVNVFPSNKDLPSINGLYIHFDGKTGEPLCIIDAKALTNKRTAAASALASTYLSRKNSKKMLLIGTGSLAPDLIKAHTSVRSLEKIYVWGRNYEKAANISQQFKMEELMVIPVKDLDAAIAEVDIISSATMSKEPLIKGELVRKGTHIDLVGSYKPDMREADDEVIKKARVYVDTMEGATKETGDIVIPINNKVIAINDIRGDLNGLCSGKIEGRKIHEEITVFKSVGYALEDLVAGDYYFREYQKLKD